MDSDLVRSGQRRIESRGGQDQDDDKGDSSQH
jgi:hypothetical protein